MPEAFNFCFASFAHMRHISNSLIHMKKHIKKTVFSAAALFLLVLAGCKDEARAAYWWMPDPWSPMTIVTVSSSGGGAGAASGGSASAGGF